MQRTDHADDVEFMLFPRLAAIAEIDWSPSPDERARDFAEVAERVVDLAMLWDASGTVYCAVDRS